MPDPSDRHLSSLLSDLAARVAGSGTGQAFVRLDDPSGTDAASIDAFEAAGLIGKAEPARSAICDGCERACPMEVTWPGGNRGPFIACDKRDDIGRVPVDPARLLQWSVSLEQLARTMAPLLDTEGTPEPMPNVTGWRLGQLRSHGTETPVRMVVADDGADFWGLTVALVPGARDGASISLAELLLFRGGMISLDRRALNRALGTRIDDARVALEIKVVGRDIVLVNHVLGSSRTVARPDFNTVNDNVFAAIYADPGRKFTLDEIRQIANTKTLRSLDKIVEQLKFVGLLRKLFFDVSKTAIRFRRTVTMGELAALRVDPAEFS